MKKYKFLRLVDGEIKSDSGNCTWKVGTWKTHTGSIDLCRAGFHASSLPYDAFSYVQGELLAEVEVKGGLIEEGDKSVHKSMRIIKVWKWQKQDSVAFSIFAARLCLDNWKKEYPNDDRVEKAIIAAERWLKDPTEDNRKAAESARSAAESARSAAWSAAESARSAARSAAESARSAARSAAESARSAARSAAWSAAESARSAAWSAVIKKCNNWIIDRIKLLEEYKEAQS